MDEDEIGDVLDTLGDEHARAILAATNREPHSAKELSDACDLSLATVYRRIEQLQDYGLLSNRTLIADDGNHYKVFECDFRSAVLALEEDEYEMQLYHRDQEGLPERFGRLWDELSPD